VIKLYTELNQRNTGRPEIDRSQLRDLLLNSLKPGTVNWDCALESLEQRDSLVLLKFRSGQTAEADLVVGADGTWSRVRPSVSDAVPVHTGVSFFECTIEKPSQELTKLVGNGSFFALSDRKGIVAQVNSGGVIRVYFSMACSERNELANAPYEVVRESLTKEYEGWNPEVLRPLDEAKGPFIFRPIYALPVEIE
jgi:2-polyprenyl-6-methoxyphenol hydroxylase-like FAD-dependent oxidoreductase